MNNSETLIAVIVLLSIFLIWRSFNQKTKKKKVTTKTTSAKPRTNSVKENPDCIPPKGSRITIVVRSAVFRSIADGKSTLQTLQESILWNNEDRVKRLAKDTIPGVLENLIPTKTPFMWKLEYENHT
jgi:hypothetical protein